MLTLGAGLTAAIRWGPLYRGPLPDLRPGSVSVPVGVNFGAGLEKTMERWTFAQRLRTMRAVARLGARWVRIDVPYLGPRRPWGDAAVVTAALAAGLHVDALLDDWSADRRPPPVLFAAFAARVAGAYARRGVEVYEVLNEENLGSNWGGAASAPGYAALLGRVYRAVKAADPRATVLVGGLSPAPAGGGDVAPVAFLQELYAAGAGGSFDGVAVHPYTYPGLPSIVDPSNSFAQMVRLRRVMSSHGDGGKRVWITEFGAPTAGGGSVGYVGQADLLAAALRQVDRWPWVAAFMVYDWRDDPVGGPFGLLAGDGRPKPAAVVLARALSGRAPSPVTG